MNLILTVLEVCAPVFLVAAAGFAWVRLGFEYRLEFVTRVAMTLALPCLIFVALMDSDIDPGALQALAGATIVAYAIVTVLLWAVVALARLDRRTYLAPIIMGNTGNVGLPLALFAFGETGLGYAVVVLAIMMVYSFTFGVWLVAGGGSLRPVLREPVVWATLLGLLFLWQDWSTPRFLTTTLELVGQMTIPLMLLTLGVAVARLTPARIGRAVWLSAVKAAICIAVAWIVGLAFPLDRTAFAILVLQLAAPVAVTSYMLAEKYGADAEAVAGLVVVSTSMAILVLPALLAVLL